MLTVDTIPLRLLPIFNCRLPILNHVGLPKSEIGNRQSAMILLGFLVTSVLAATAAEFAEFQPIGRGLLILGRHVIPTFTVLALKHNIIAWHFFTSNALIQ